MVCIALPSPRFRNPASKRMRNTLQLYSSMYPITWYGNSHTIQYYSTPSNVGENAEIPTPASKRGVTTKIKTNNYLTAPLSLISDSTATALARQSGLTVRKQVWVSISKGRPKELSGYLLTVLTTVPCLPQILPNSPNARVGKKAHRGLALSPRFSLPHRGVSQSPLARPYSFAFAYRRC